MNCKHCGAELIGNSSFCVKCGRNNNEETAENKPESLESPNGNKDTNNRKSINLKIVLIPVILIIISVTALIVAMVIPCTPKASLESGKYEECKKISFEVSRIFPFGKEPELYIAIDGGSFNLYDGREFYLNQARSYSYDVYSVNGAGIKSSEKHFEYNMNVPRPAELSVNVNPGRYEDYKDIEIKTNDGSTVYFTTDGTEPTGYSNVYKKPIHLDNGNTTIKAFAINDKGTAGDVYQWDYELVFPTPSEVSYSADSGVYYSAFDLKLKSDDNAKIFYTLDGSDPTANSIEYTEPIKLKKGIHTVKAIAINKYDMQSEIESCNYAITLPKFARYSRSAVAGNYYGVAGGDTGALAAYDSEMNEIERYEEDGVSSIYSDGSNIYYLMSNELYKLDTENGTTDKLIDMYIDCFALVNSTIYIEASDALYSTNLNGKNLLKIDSMDGCMISGVWENILYCKKGNKIFKIISPKKKPKSVTKISGTKAFVKNDKVYYINSNNGISYKNMKKGSDKEILSTSSDTYNLDSPNEWFNVEDKTETVTKTYVDMYACNNTLYVLERIYDEYRTYHRMTSSTDVDSNSTYYNWYAINMKNNRVSYTNIATPQITVFDDCIMDGNGNKNQVVQ